MKGLRYLFTGDKHQFRDDVQGFSLDLTYITDRIIAMGYPTHGRIRKYVRNPVSEVARFLQTYHPKKYMVFNLAPELHYDFSRFENRVMCFGFNDHCAPPLDLLVKVVRAIDEWLKSDPENCAFVHCKAGRGRTGTVIASYLLYSGYFKDAQLDNSEQVEIALSYFAGKRSKRGEGVEVPSQRRYVEYFYKLITEPVHLIRKLKLVGMIFQFFPVEFLSGFHFKITNLDIVSPNLHPAPTIFYAHPFIQWLPNGDLFLQLSEREILLEGDVMMIFRHQKSILGSGKKIRLFRLSFHTAFIQDSLELNKSQLDGSHSNYLKNTKFPPAFTVILLFNTIESIENQLHNL